MRDSMASAGNSPTAKPLAQLVLGQEIARRAHSHAVNAKLLRSRYPEVSRKKDNSVLLPATRCHSLATRFPGKPFIYKGFQRILRGWSRVESNHYLRLRRPPHPHQGLRQVNWTCLPVAVGELGVVYRVRGADPIHHHWQSTHEASRSRQSERV